jgi:GAF domain-containing protein
VARPVSDIDVRDRATVTTRSTELRHRKAADQAGEPHRPAARRSAPERTLLPPTRGRLVAGLVIAVVASLLAAPVATSPSLARFSGLPFFVVILSATFVGRLLPGILSAVLAGILLETYVIPRTESLSDAGASDIVAIAAFALVTLGVGAILARLDRATAEERRANERLRFVTRAGEVLSSTLDFERTLRQLADLAVAGLGDWCVVHVPDDQGTIRVAVVASSDPELLPELRRLTAVERASSAEFATLQRVLGNRTSEMQTAETAGVAGDTPLDDERRSDGHPLGARATIVVPLTAAGRTFGAMTVATTRSQGFSSSEIAVAEQLADWAALSLANADLFRQGESARARVALVSDVSELLAQELHYPAAFRRLAEVLARRFADVVLIDTLDPQGAIERVLALHRDPAKQPLADELRMQYAPSLSGKHPVARVIRGGGAEYASEMPAEFLRETTLDERHFRLVTELGFSSFMCLPLEARGRILGALTLVSTSPAHRYGPEDLQLGQEIARRAGVRIENARLYEEQRHIATTLQRSLLPASLPVVPGVEVAVRYWAQGEGTEVGGDFYDVFGTSTDTWMLMVGDVCGKGPEAAAFVGAARHSARALATQGLGPVPLLEALNRSLIDLPAEGRFCTAVVAEIRPSERGIALAVAAAGHPAPIVVRRDGAIQHVDAKGALLGVFDEIHLTPSSLILEPGDSVFFFTDGVLERPSGDVGRTRDLSALLQGAERSSLDDVMARIEGELKPGTLLDDVALAALRVTR